MSETTRLIKNTAYIALGNMGAKVTSFLLLPLYTSVLSTSEYGTYDLIVAVSSFVAPFVLVGMHEAMFRFLIERGDSPQEFRRIVSNTLIVVLAGFLAAGAVGCIIYWLARIDYLPMVLAYLFANCLYTISNNILRGMGEMGSYALISTGKNILQVVLNVLAVLVLRLGVGGLVASLFVSEILAFLVMFIWKRLWRQINLRLFSPELVREMLAYSLPLIPNSLGAQIINLSDRLLITAILGSAANGVYAISYKFPNVVETVYHYFYTAWCESASRVIKRGSEAAREYYQKLYDAIDSLVFAVVVVMVAAMPILFRVFVRGDYVQGFGYVPLLMYAMYLNCIAMFYTGIFTAYKDTRTLGLATGVSAVINVVVNVLTLARFGIAGAAFTTLLSQVITYGIQFVRLRSLVKIEQHVGAWAVKLIAVVVITLLYRYDSVPFLVASLLVSLCAGIYLNRGLLVSMLSKVRGR